MSFLKKNRPTSPVTTKPHAIKHAPDVLLRPIVSEKASRLQSQGQYTFAVLPGVSKVEVKKAIEATYGVRVMGVNSLKLPRKTVRRGRTVGYTRERRHVVVRLAAGQSLNLGGTSR